MQLQVLREGRDSELICGLMASVEPAGGIQAPVPGRSVRIGLLKEDQIPAFCAEVKKYILTRPKFPPSNRALLSRLFVALEFDAFNSLLIIKRNVTAEVHASYLVGSFDGILDSRNEIAEAISKFDIDLAGLEPVAA